MRFADEQCAEHAGLTVSSSEDVIDFAVTLLGGGVVEWVFRVRQRLGSRARGVVAGRSLGGMVAAGVHYEERRARVCSPCCAAVRVIGGMVVCVVALLCGA